MDYSSARKEVIKIALISKEGKNISEPNTT